MIKYTFEISKMCSGSMVPERSVSPMTAFICSCGKTLNLGIRTEDSRNFWGTYAQ